MLKKIASYWFFENRKISVLISYNIMQVLQILTKDYLSTSFLRCIPLLPEIMISTFPQFIKLRNSLSLLNMNFFL